MDDSLAYGPWFFERRHQWIADADRLIAEAAEAIEEAAVKPARLRRAERLYAKSARLYRRAGLGVMAQASLQDAADCAETLGDRETSRLYAAAADEIETYYDEEIA
jgi:hypothetical protein